MIRIRKSRRNRLHKIPHTLVGETASMKKSRFSGTYASHFDTLDLHQNVSNKMSRNITFDTTSYPFKKVRTPLLFSYP